MNRHSLDYYRVPSEFTEYQMPEALPQQRSFFKWDDCTMCYGRAAVDAKRAPMPSIGTSAEDSEVKEGIPSFPFNAEEVIENLQRERYSAHFREPGRLTHALLRKAYYLVRPWLSVGARVQLQRMHLRNWEKIPFPEWPVDTTVDRIHRKLLKHAMQARGVDKVPFIWFWPDGYTCCTIITHDVESAGGKKECARLMDVDESFGFRSSFQIVPEDRYAVTRSFLQSITERGFEVNVHDLKHDGRLYADFKEFLRRARLINQYGQSVALQVTFNPASATSYTGTLTVTSNASSNSTVTVPLSGTGVATAYTVALTWSAPTSSTDPVAGYDVYRALSGSSTYQLLNPTPSTTTTYSDSSVANGQTYLYYVVSVDASGNQSSPSNTYTATIP